MLTKIFERGKMKLRNYKRRTDHGPNDRRNSLISIIEKISIEEPKQSITYVY
ncbi:hypothetical protein SCODD09_00637 [Streptococcus constellatus]|nr:hypothetical protein SCODD09_00637 [Streptococcus constellatus]